jgi:hypothetical protein
MLESLDSNQIGAGITDRAIQLDQDHPIVFFPLRLETKFDRNHLLVRVYPDQILINQHKSDLTPAEIDAGKLFWTELNKNRQSREELWARLTILFHPNRALWIIRRTKPVNWDEQSVNQVLKFPDSGSLSQSLQPENLLPENLLLVLETIDRQIIVVKGNTIPRDLALAPDFSDQGRSFSKEETKFNSIIDEKIKSGDHIRWLSDFSSAIDKGMAFKVDVGNVSQVNWLLVVGVNKTLGAKGGQGLNRLFEGHYYSSEGLELLPQGTPTNNTEQADSGYVHDLSGQGRTLRELDLTTSAVGTAQILKSDQQRLAEALGLEFRDSIFRFVGPHRHSERDYPGNGLRDAREASLMNAALSSATFDFYLRNELSSLFTEDLHSELRKHFIDHVTGRGPLPVMRKGNQPYGWVLCTDLNNISAENDNPVLKSILPLIRIINSESRLWARTAPSLENGDPKKMLDQLLQQYPTSQRYFLSSLVNRDRQNEAAKRILLQYFKHSDPAFQATQMIFSRRVSSKSNVKAFVCHVDEPATEKYQVGEINPHLLNSINNNLRLPITHRVHQNINYLEWLFVWVTTHLYGSDFNADLENQNPNYPLPLLYRVLRTSIRNQFYRVVRLWLNHENLIIKYNNSSNVQNLRNDPSLQDYLSLSVNTLYDNLGAEFKEYNITSYIFNIQSQLKGMSIIDKSTQKPRQLILSDLNPLERLKTFSIERQWETLQNRLVRNKDYSPQLHQAYIELVDLVESLGILSALPTARLERCFAEHLDTLTYRSDAWVTGYLSSVLNSRRNSANNKTGTYVGAYGWLHSIVSNTGKSFADAGYVHAPSLAQASTAALLKNAFHQSDAKVSSFEIDLSSERVRKGLFLLEGLQAGHAMSALLGYQFERALHDDEQYLDMLNLRNSHGLKNKNLINGNETASPLIVDGLKLIQNKNELTQYAKYINDLEQSVDALSDIVMAEAVHQYSIGNIDRAASVLKSLTDNAPPVSPEFVKTPRTSQMQLTNRVCLLFDDLTNRSSNLSTPRAKVSPEINYWLIQKIGLLSQICLSVAELSADGSPITPVTISLNELALEPIDLVFILPEVLGGQRGPVLLGNEEWGMRIRQAYNRINGVTDIDPNQKIQVDYFAKPNGVSKVPLGEKHFLINSLKKLISNSKYLSSEQFNLKISDENVKAFELKCDQVIDLLAKYPEADKYAYLLNAALYGFNSALEVLVTSNISDNLERIDRLFNSTKSFVANAVRQAKELRSQPNNSMSNLDRIESCIKAIKILFNGTVFPTPLFTIENQVLTDLIRSDSNRVRLLVNAVKSMNAPDEDALIDTWLTGVHQLRPNVGNLQWVNLISFKQRQRPNKTKHKVWQIPYKNDDQWVAVPHSARNLGNKSSYVVEYNGNLAGKSPQSKFCGLLIDEWVEGIPSLEETTGIAMNINKPNAQPPQALLCSIKCDGTPGWKYPEIVQSVLHAFKLSVIRGADPDKLPNRIWKEIIPATVIQS